MDTDQTPAHDVTARIRDAFSTTPYPGDANVVANSSADDRESAAVADAFRAKAWQSISIPDVRRHASALPLLTPDAFRFVLPAYMIAVVDGPREVDVAKDNVLFNLTPPANRSGWQWSFFHSRSQLFTEAEREAIRGFLRWMDAFERANWESVGRRAPEDRVAPALRFWEALDGQGEP
jgi:hypothetical protein